MSDLTDAALLAAYFAACERRKVSIADAEVACNRYNESEVQTVHQLAKAERNGRKRAAIGGILKALQNSELSREQLEFELESQGFQIARSTLQGWLSGLVEEGVLEVNAQRVRRNHTSSFVGFYSLCHQLKQSA